MIELFYLWLPSIKFSVFLCVCFGSFRLPSQGNVRPLVWSFIFAFMFGYVAYMWLYALLASCAWVHVSFSSSTWLFFMTSVCYFDRFINCHLLPFHHFGSLMVPCMTCLHAGSFCIGQFLCCFFCKCHWYAGFFESSITLAIISSSFMVLDALYGVILSSLMLPSKWNLSLLSFMEFWCAVIFLKRNYPLM